MRILRYWYFLPDWGLRKIFITKQRKKFAAARGGQAPATAGFHDFMSKSQINAQADFLYFFNLKRQKTKIISFEKISLKRKKPAEQIKAAAVLRKIKLWEGNIPVSCSRIFHVFWQFIAFQIQKVFFQN